MHPAQPRVHATVQQRELPAALTRTVAERAVTDPLVTVTDIYDINDTLKTELTEGGSLGLEGGSSAQSALPGYTVNVVNVSKCP